MKLKYKDVATVRAALLERQVNACALCGDTIVDDAVLDHDHNTGMIRCVLHRGCNALLGKIENNMLRNRISKARLEVIAERLINYITDTHTDMTHPTYKTPEEKAMKKKKGRGRGRGR